MSRQQKLAKNTLIIGIGVMLPKLTSFITLPILTGCLTQEEYGIYDLILVLVSLLLPAVTLQIQGAAFRFLLEAQKNEIEKKQIITNIYIFILAVSSITLLILFVVLYSQGFWLSILICLYFFLDILVNTTRQIIRGLSKTYIYSVSAIISSVCQMLVVLITVRWLGLGLPGGVLALALGAGISCVYLILSTKLWKYIDFKYRDKSILKKMLNYSWPLVPNSMSSWIMRMSSRLVISFFMGIEANAIFAVANKIPQLLYVAQQTFTLAWQENASIASKDNDAGQYYSMMYRVMFDLMGGAMCLIIGFTPAIFGILVRGNYDNAYAQVPILLVATFFSSMATFVGGIYIAYKASGSVGITTIITAFINLIVDIILIKYIGLYAASCAMLISYGILLVYRMIDVQKLVSIKYQTKHMLIVLFLLIVQCIIFYQDEIFFDVIGVIYSMVIFCVLNRRIIASVLQTIKKKLKK